MFKPTRTLSINLRRLPLTTKKGPKKGYYKGNRTGTVGTHTKFGNFSIDYNRVRTYVVPPDLKDCPLTPFVDKRVEKPENDPRAKTMTYAQMYLQDWKEQNGVS